MIRLLTAVVLLAVLAPAQGQSTWWRGNLHTHSLWSDGDDFPEMIVDLYKRNGYHFLAISDHNTMHVGRTNVMIYGSSLRKLAKDKYLKRFGPRWVELTKDKNNREFIRLKTFNEYRGLFEEPGRFLRLPAEEITDRWLANKIHLNAVNLRYPIAPQGGKNVLELMQNNVDAVLRQKRETGQAMFPHLNHPNYTYGVTAEELMRVRGENFFEVYNGNNGARNRGDENHASCDRIWDIVNAHRITQLNLPLMYGLAVDDAHNYHSFKMSRDNPGRGWIMVRAPRLTANDLIAALEQGDFYSSTGVRLLEVYAGKRGLLVAVAPQSGVEYTIQFIGTRRGFSTRSQPVRSKGGEKLRITHRYSPQIGAVLQEVKGTKAMYRYHGDELYVRAKIISSKPHPNPAEEGDVETAWTQPVVPGR